MNGTMLFPLGPQAPLLSILEVVVWKVEVCSTLIEMIFHECSDYGLKSSRESMLGICAILQVRYTILDNKYHMHRK